MSAKDLTEILPGCGPLALRTGGDSVPLRQRIFEHIRAAGEAPRRDIARALSVSPGSVTQLTSELIAAGFLEETLGRPETANREQTRGRPPVALRVSRDAGLVAGIKLSDEQHSVVLIDMAGNQIADCTVPSGALRQDLESTLDQSEALLNRVMEQAGLPRSALSGVGVGIPGTVDPLAGVVAWSPILQDADTALGPALSQRFGLPVWIENDTNVLTLAEMWFGAGRAMSDFAVVTIERGVGLGIVLGGRLFRGAQGSGTELGHTKVHLDGALCRCGQRGCLEAYVADYALVREASVALELGADDATPLGQTLERLFDRAKAGDAAARSIFRRAGRYLALGLANVVQLFDPARIILSGERMRYDYLYAEEALSEMRLMTLNSARAATPVDIHAWGGLIWARGAAALALAEATDAALGEGRDSVS